MSCISIVRRKRNAFLVVFVVGSMLSPSQAGQVQAKNRTTVRSSPHSVTLNWAKSSDKIPANSYNLYRAEATKERDGKLSCRKKPLKIAAVDAPSASYEDHSVKSRHS
jgi:hypothetical protein